MVSEWLRLTKHTRTEKSNTCRSLSYATPMPKEYTARAHSYNPLALLLPRGKLSSTTSITTPPLAITLPGQSSPFPYMIIIKSQHDRERLPGLQVRAEWATTTCTFLTGCRLRMPNPDLMHVYRKILLYLLEVGFEQTSTSILTAGKLEQGEVPYKLLVWLETGEMQTEPRCAYQYPTVQSQAMVPHWETKQIWIPLPLVFKNTIISAIQLRYSISLSSW